MNSQFTSKHTKENANETIYFWTTKQFRMFMHANICERVFILVDIKQFFLFQSSIKMKPKRKAKQKKNIKRIGSRKVKERKANCLMEDDIQEALHKLKSVPSSKIRSKYGAN